MTSKPLSITYRAIFIFYFSLSSSCPEDSSSTRQTAPTTTHQANLLGKTETVRQAQPTTTALGSIASQDTPTTIHEPDPIPEIDQIKPQNRPEAINEPPQKTRKIQVALVKPDEQAIVLLHGLNRNYSDFQTMKKRLEEAFPKAKIIALESVNKDNTHNNLTNPPPSVTLSIEDQATQAYQEIKAKVGNNKQLVIIGHSQGGLRGLALAKNHANTLYNEAKIGIKKLITIGTPWKGAPVMQHLYNQTQTNNSLNDLASTLDKISEGFKEDIKHHLLRVPKRIQEIAEKLPFLYNYFGNKVMHHSMTGVVDLKPDSDFIQNYVGKNLKNFAIPVSAIAGVLTDFSQIFDPFPSHITQNELQRLNSTYAILIGGSSTCEHDMLLPVDTQHAIGVEKNNFECIKIVGTCHGNKVGMPVKKGVPELQHEAVIQKVIALITEVFYKEETEEVAA